MGFIAWKGSTPSRAVSLSWPFDFDDLGSEVCHDFGAKGSGDHFRQFDNCEIA
jgi:hypothetical protein